MLPFTAYLVLYTFLFIMYSTKLLSGYGDSVHFVLIGLLALLAVSASYDIFRHIVDKN